MSGSWEVSDPGNVQVGKYYLTPNGERFLVEAVLWNKSSKQYVAHGYAGTRYDCYYCSDLRKIDDGKEQR